MRIRAFLLALALAVAPGMSAALASPWAEVGDNQLRGDIELLQAAGVLDAVTIHWPLPWRSISAALSQISLSDQPAAVRAAAARVLARAHGADSGWRGRGFADVTNLPSVVHGFDGMGRGKGEGQLSLEDVGDHIAGRISLGVFASDFGGRGTKLMADGTYFAADWVGVRAYVGYLDHWWGPGQISALQLSNNARPMPQIGFERASTQASSWPVLRWLGPWQFEFILATFDGQQKQSNVRFNAARLTINPLPGLELGAAKTEQFCGQGHPCAPLRDYFQNIDFSTHPNNVNGEGSFDAKYSHTLGGIPFQVYAQVMMEDYSLVNHADASHLAGAGVWVPTSGNPVKLTFEFADTITTRTLFGFDTPEYAVSYNDYQYPDGMRYGGRTLGFSLDDDSTLLSLQGSWNDAGGRFYELTLQHAAIGTSHTPSGANVVSSAPVLLNLAELRVGLPWQGMRFDIAGRVQDDQPRPHSGFAAALEMALSKDF